MDKKLFQETFSAVHASKAVVSEVLEMATERKTNDSGRSSLRVILIAAVMVMLVATTVFAASVIRNALVGGSLESEGMSFTLMDAGNEKLNRYEVWLDVDMNEDAPESIETYYMPQLDDRYKQYFGYVYQHSAVVYMWTCGEACWENEVRFYQTAGGAFDPNEEIAWVYTLPEELPEAKMIELNGIQGYLVGNSFGYGSKSFFWSDGDYLFQLNVPDEYTNDDIAKLLQSIVTVENIEPYCISMTEEEYEKYAK